MTCPAPTRSTGRPEPTRPRILTRPLALRFVSVVASSIGFFLPLGVVPLYAAQSGTAATGGLATGALLLTTVGVELLSPRIIRVLGHRWALAVGLLLLGPPTLLLLVSPAPSVLLVTCVLRGAGFAIVVVAGGALTALLIPAERRGEGLAVVGLVTGVTTLIALPAGVWLAGQYGFGVVFGATAAAPVLALVTVPFLPAKETAADRPRGMLTWLRSADLNRPALVFAASTVAVGALTTFLPLAMSGAATWVAPAALLAHSAAATGSKWIAGRLGDTHGHVRLLAPGVIASVAGMALLALTGSPVTVLVGATTFGLGFGLLQNATLTLMYSRVTTAGYGPVSAIWNAAYDVGMAVGALGVGFVVGLIGYPTAFLLVAVSMLPALLLIRRERWRTPTEQEPSERPSVTSTSARDVNGSRAAGLTTGKGTI
ncbi:MFS transporter [Nonomuraea africana]|uniref:MFS family permease n=1 Tax=Nonomuraea africana TaxID=46171 RepID=A0ABR9KCL9_9ACTN|nr:MFS transporter [Nonomuraea africana]MBE1559754.1 MFS family permease [Nonomuraea africana]